MASTGARTLALLALLEARRYWPGDELATRLGVSPRTLRRDVERLRELGYPVEAARGVGGGYQLGAGTALPPLVLDDEEAVALVVGLHAAADAGVAGVAESSVRALAKTLALMPARLRRRADALRAATVAGAWHPGGAQVAPEVLDVVARACHDEVRLGFAYTARDGVATERYVEPYRLVVLARRWYLLAFDLDRDDWRTFRVDRMREPRATVGRFEPRAAPEDPAAFVRGSIEQMPGQYDVVVDVEAAAADVDHVIGRWAVVEPLGGVSCRARMTTDELEWPILALLRLDADFAVVEPPELAARVGEVAARFARATGEPGVRPRRGRAGA